MRQEVLTLETNLENKEAIIATMQGNAAEFGGIRERLATALADAARQSALASEKAALAQQLESAATRAPAKKSGPPPPSVWPPPLE